MTWYIPSLFHSLPSSPSTFHVPFFFVQTSKIKVFSLKLRRLNKHQSQISGTKSEFCPIFYCPGHSTKNGRVSKYSLP